MALTCVVGCKLPHGLQVRLGEKVTKVAANDPRDHHMVVTDAGTTVALKGTHHRNEDGQPAAIGGYGLTTVDADGFKAWLADNKDHPAVKNGLIFIERDVNTAKGAARERASVKNGVERMDYDNPMGDNSVQPTKTLEQARQEAAEQAAAQ